jgi:uncharacterized membrane protein YhhN
MPETPTTRAPLPLHRWLLPAALLVLGLVLFFWLAPDLEPAGRLGAVEVLP